MDASQGHTYHRLQQLHVGQGLAQETHAGRLGGQERVHHRGVTRGPSQQAWRSNKKQLLLVGHLLHSHRRPATGHHPIGHHLSDIKTGWLAQGDVQLARTGV